MPSARRSTRLRAEVLHLQRLVGIAAASPGVSRAGAQSSSAATGSTVGPNWPSSPAPSPERPSRCGPVSVLVARSRRLRASRTAPSTSRAWERPVRCGGPTASPLDGHGRRRRADAGGDGPAVRRGPGRGVLPLVPDGRPRPALVAAAAAGPGRRGRSIPMGRRARAGEPSGRAAPAPRVRLHGLPARPLRPDRASRRPPAGRGLAQRRLPRRRVVVVEDAVASAWKGRALRGTVRSTPGWTCGVCSRTPASASTSRRARTSPANASRRSASGRRSSCPSDSGPAALHAQRRWRSDLRRPGRAARRRDHFAGRGLPVRGFGGRPALRRCPVRRCWGVRRPRAGAPHRATPVNQRCPPRRRAPTVFDHVVAGALQAKLAQIEQWLRLDLPPQKAVPGTE